MFHTLCWRHLQSSEGPLTPQIIYSQGCGTRAYQWTEAFSVFYGPTLLSDPLPHYSPVWVTWTPCVPDDVIMRRQQPVSLSHHVEGSHPLDPEPRTDLDWWCTNLWDVRCVWTAAEFSPNWIIRHDNMCSKPHNILIFFLLRLWYSFTTPVFREFFIWLSFFLMNKL